MAFNWRQKVLFKHCDPAGIVFYPRYFEMINDCVEQFFCDVLHYPFEEFLSKQGGVPTVQIETRFTAISRHGDWLDFTLQPTRLGRSSFTFTLSAECEGETRLEARLVLVHVHEFAAAAWPQPVRETIEQMIAEQPQQTA